MLSVRSIFFSWSMVFWAAASINAQSASDLLDKSIKYHDPHNKWESFHGTMYFIQPRAGRSDTTTREVHLHMEKEEFYMKQVSSEKVVTRKLIKDTCVVSLNNDSNLSSETKKKERLNCSDVSMYKNYYAYLYGLPMKLKDPGTRIDSEVIETEFQGKECLAIRVTYDPGVGDDIWYFYFDKSTARMIGYRFYHDEKANDGEYIILKEELEVDGIKMPRDRYWYYNKDNGFLGVDLMVEKL